MQNTKPKPGSLKHCQPMLWTQAFAEEEYQGIVAILAGIWLLYLAWLRQYLDVETLTSGTIRLTSTTLARAIPGVISVLLSHKLLAYAQNLMRGAGELARDGVVVNARIIDRWQPEAGQGRDELIAYRFDYQGAGWIGEQPVNPSCADRKVGDDIAVRVLPRNPRICAIATATRQRADRTPRLVSRQIKAAARRWSGPSRTLQPTC